MPKLPGVSHRRIIPRANPINAFTMAGIITAASWPRNPKSEIWNHA